MQRQPLILICDDDPVFHMAVRYCLEGKYQCLFSYNTDEAAEIIKNNAVDVLLLDIQLRTPEEGLNFIPKILESEPDLAILVVSGRTDFAAVRKGLTLGALDYIAKEFDSKELIHVIDQTLSRQALVQRNSQRNFEAETYQQQYQLIGNSQKIQTVRNLIERIKKSPQASHILITGETGTGKELVARLFRRTLEDGSLAPFISIDAATLHSDSVEQLLFGYEKGAFPQANKSKRGVFEEADGGTVYLDEVSHLSLEIQSKLLRVLEHREVVRVGSVKAVQVDFQVISATHVNLVSLINQGKFKQELYQRLNVIPIEIPPLRDRKEDIPLLADYFLKQWNASRTTEMKFTENALKVLQAYSWPGNVRELKNLIAYLSTVSEVNEIDVTELPPSIQTAAQKAFSTPTHSSVDIATGDDSRSFYERIAYFEKEVLSKEYERAAGNISRLASNLKMDRSYLYTKLREHKLHSKN